MTGICFTLYNHYESVHEPIMDLLKPFAFAFQDLGHTVVFRKDGIATDALNIVTEFFDRDADDKLLESGVRYALIQTEMMTGDTFNNDGIFRQRYKRFMRVAERAEFVINLVGDTKVPCPSFKCEPGYHPKLMKPDTVTPSVDFCFFGTRSHRRDEMIKMICNRGVVVAFCDGAGTEERNRAIQNSKYVLGLRAHWPLECVSLTRISAALHNQRPVLHERVPVTGRLAHVPFIHHDQDEFDEWCVGLLSKPGLWEATKDLQLETFKKCHVTEMMADAMRRANVKI
mgnify:CR=1 FL=1